jgi:predicted SprT family Zn-dependent metalloprotease
MIIDDVILIEYDQETIDYKRQSIKEKLIYMSSNIDGDNFKQINDSDLNILFELYNDEFFHNVIDTTITQMNLKFSRRLKKSGGITKTYKNQVQKTKFEININIEMVFRYNYNGEERSACGIVINSSLDALLLIFEHELCHVLEYLCFNSSNCKKERFKLIANNLFGHRGSTHNLLTVSEKLNKEFGLKAGDIVEFKYNGHKFTGQIQRITKRATVFVEDSIGMYISKTTGKRYKKYLIPLELLQKV